MDINELELNMLKTLPLEELKVRSNKMHKEMSLVDNLIEEYEYNKLKQEYSTDFCEEKCKFSAVFDLSCDGWHNKCGHYKASCTCCDCPCLYYQPDNDMSKWIKENIGTIEERVAQAIMDLRLPLWVNGSEEDAELVKLLLSKRYNYKLKKQP